MTTFRVSHPTKLDDPAMAPPTRLALANAGLTSRWLDSLPSARLESFRSQNKKTAVVGEDLDVEAFFV